MKIKYFFSCNIIMKNGYIYRKQCLWQALKLLSFPSICHLFLDNYFIQVAQLWERDCAKLDTFSISVQCYLQNHAQNCIFGPPYGGISGNISTLSDSFNANKLCVRVSLRMSVLLVKRRISVSGPPFGG